MDIFKNRLKELRLERGVKQKELSEHLGLTLRAYQYYEAGNRYPDFQGLLALADYFNVSIDYLVGRSDQK